MTDNVAGAEGGCTCGEVRYRVASAPLIVHACHCRVCQRQNGAAFAVNGLIEADRVEVIKGAPVDCLVESPSGAGQNIVRCPKCHTAVWSNYLVVGGNLGRMVRFIRVGTLDRPELMAPDVHIYTESMQPWMMLPPDTLAVDTYYETRETWSPDSLKRLDALRAKVEPVPPES